MSSKSSKKDMGASNQDFNQTERYYCNTVYTFKENLDYDSVEFCPKNMAGYLWELSGHRNNGKQISFSLYPQFMERMRDKMLSTNYTLTVECSDGTLVQQWTVKNNMHSERENLVKHIVDCCEDLVVYLSLTFALQPMGGSESVPKRCMPINTIVRAFCSQRPGEARQNHQERCEQFKSMWMIPNSKIDAMLDNETLSEKVIAAGDGTGCDLSLKIYKGAISVIILTEFVQGRATSQAETCRVRYNLAVENARKDRIANWNVDCDFSASFSLLQVFPSGDVVASMAGNLVFHLGGFLVDIISSDNSSSRADVSTTGSEREQRYYANLLTQRSFCDATLAVEDSGSCYDVPCHRVILSAKSPVFQSIFAANIQQRKVPISGLNLKCVQNMLDHIYCSQRFNDSLELSDVKCLLEAADRFQIAELKELCEHKLMHAVRPDNILELFKLSEVSHAQQLQNFIYNFVCENKEVFNCVNEMLRSESHGLDKDQKTKLLFELTVKTAMNMFPK